MPRGGKGFTEEKIDCANVPRNTKALVKSCAVKNLSAKTTNQKPQATKG
jgi:hypothetical protein